MAETMTLEAPFCSAAGDFLASMLSGERSIERFSATDTAKSRDDARDGERAAELAEIARLFGLVEILHGRIEKEALEISSVKEILPNMKTKWIATARWFDNRSKETITMVQRGREAIDKRQQNDAFLKEDYTRLMDRMEELADLMEDIAETMELAVHEPFRKMVNKELESIGVA